MGSDGQRTEEHCKLAELTCASPACAFALGNFWEGLFHFSAALVIPITILCSFRKFCAQATFIFGQKHLGKFETTTNSLKIVTVVFKQVVSLAGVCVGLQGLCSVTAVS